MILGKYLVFAKWWSCMPSHLRQRTCLRNDVGALLEETLSVRDLPSHEKRRVFEQLDRKFHLEIISAAGNKRLVDFFMPIASFVDLMRNLNVRVDEALEEHIAILEAMHAGNMSLAQTLLEEHLDIVEQAIMTTRSISEGTGASKE